jgi:hypothetical protein
VVETECSRVDSRAVSSGFAYSYGASIFAGYPCEVFTLDGSISSITLSHLLDAIREEDETEVLGRVNQAPERKSAPLTICLGDKLYLLLRLTADERARYRRTMAPLLALRDGTPVLAVLPGG